MNRRVLLRKSWLAFLFLVIYLSLGAITPQQAKATTQLREIFGSESKIEFQNGNSIISNVYGSNTNFKVADFVAARTEADKLLKGIRPYTHVTMKQIESVDREYADYNPKALEIIYIQKNIWGIDFEKNPSITFIFYETGGVKIENTFIYDFVLPKRPYITKEQAEEFAKAEFIKVSNRRFHSNSTKDDENTITNLPRHDIGLYICKFQKDRNVEYYKVAYCFMIYGTICSIYIDAKTGNVLACILMGTG